jgi:hypothetical protein
MTLLKPIVPALLLALAAASIWLVVASGDAATAARCPRHAVRRPVPVEEVVGAARRLLPRVYHISNQQGPVKLTRANTEILEVVSLSPYQRRLVGAKSLRRLARSRCGRIADASWAVGVYFTELTVADNLSYAFLTRTPRGWTIWR